MNDLHVFKFGDKPVRTVLIDGQPWWVAKDVAETLEYEWKGAAGTLPHIPGEWKGIRSVQTPYGMQEMAILSEHGLYFFLARSDKPKALPFQKWIAGEVLPSIRKTGAYVFDPAKMSRLQILELAIDSEKKYLAEKMINEQNRPKIQAYDAFLDGSNYQSIGVVAKALGYGRTTFFKMLRDAGIFMRDNVPFQLYMDRGFFVVKERPINMGDHIENKPQTFVTPNGLDYLSKKFRILISV